MSGPSRRLAAGLFLLVALGLVVWSTMDGESPDTTTARPTPTAIVRGGAISGVVTWFRGSQREPVRGVELRLRRGSDESLVLYSAVDENGLFNLPNVPPGHYVLYAGQLDGPVRDEWLVPVSVLPGENRAVRLDESNGRQIGDPYWR